MPGPLRWLFLDMNSFFASCEQQRDPSLRGKPIAVLPTMAETTCVIAASYPAKRFGISVGTSVREARERCPEIIFVPAGPGRYVEVHHAILAALDKHLYVDEVLSVDEVACRLTGHQTQVAEAHKIAHAIKAQIARDVGECLTSSLGLAPNRYLGKVASDMMKPDGLVTILPEELPHRLHTLKLRDLPGIGPRMEKRLRMHGIFTMEQLCALDTLRLRRIWGGVAGARLHAELRGVDLPPRPTETSSLGHQHVLAPAERTPEGGLWHAHKLLMKAAERMRRDGYYAQHLGLQVKLAPRPGQDWKLAGYIEAGLSFHQTQDTGLLLECLHALWAEHMAGYQPMRAPWRVGVLLGGLVPVAAHQLDFFTPARRPELMQAVDRINERFGRYTVTFGQLPTETRKTGMDKIAFGRIPRLDETVPTDKPRTC